MLILSRRPDPQDNRDNTLRIGDDVKVIVLSVKGNQVRFGFEAPRGVEIHRQEIYERIHAEVQKLTEHS